MSDSSKEIKSRNRIAKYLGDDKVLAWASCAPEWAESGEGAITAPSSPDWKTNFAEAMNMYSSVMAVRSQLLEMVQQLAGEVRELRNRVGLLEQSKSSKFEIASVAPEPFTLLKNIPVCVSGTDDDFTASFVDANIAISGDTEEEAIQNLKAIIIDTFDLLEKEEANLGPGPHLQLATLREFLQRRR